MAPSSGTSTPRPDRSWPQEQGREATGPPSETETFQGDATTSTPCADFDTEDDTCWNDHPFTVPADDGSDNARATVRIQWPSTASD